jgi:hypothetical protein
MSNRRALRLNFARRMFLATVALIGLPLAVGIGVLDAPLVQAQARPASSSLAKFEVASIKPCIGGRAASRKGFRKGGNGKMAQVPTDYI